MSKNIQNTAVLSIKGNCHNKKHINNYNAE